LLLSLFQWTFPILCGVCDAQASKNSILDVIPNEPKILKYGATLLNYSRIVEYAKTETIYNNLPEARSHGCEPYDKEEEYEEEEEDA
jgi:hypothetical protein